jgi:hypothetical protein
MCFADPERAWSETRRQLIQLALVDLEGPTKLEPAGYRQLLLRLVPEPELLVVVCGHDADATEEIWVRQLGAWMYLAGVNRGSDVALVCSEARQIAEQLRPPIPAGDPLGRHRHGRRSVRRQ